MLRIATRPNEEHLILDFFAGSGTTGDAVMQLNQQDGGNRRFILAQLPERTGHEDFACISDITKARLRAASTSILAEASLRLPEMGDSGNSNLGFKVFKLDSSNLKTWDGDPAEVDAKLLAAIDNIKDSRSDDDLLYELLLKFGLDLAVPIERRTIAGKPVHVIGAGALVVCLADKLSLETVDGIAALKAELQPEVMRVVFRDTCFETDVVKTNAVQILRRAGILDIKSL